ncbi:hypothetical protein CEUSTIGMA_g1755.t1 [Chlamydomonas eustigma]|uniref:cyclin-dependent kinase n=1 Tax=Chlamydomonas eustigma TaxID=1157962 RepID=A0A250WU69_9CHLO|nr:hypothetical protein CEUSTIGMA_g1755.t1 [Chlamydomonas eustigma]|eukprot:GAX74306.1 hypothetical protein CEUSTIGMA_g1755.t1 [Chlamydomonas eustigma]
MNLNMLKLSDQAGMDRFEYVESLGEGAYGQVWSCMDKETGMMVALKRFKEAHEDEEVMRLATREIRLLKASQHPSIVKLHEAFRSRSGRVYMVMEYVKHTLTEQLQKCRYGFANDSVKLITWQLLQATAFLHCNKVIHRDLKPANILLTEDGRVKLCDFGFARTLRPSDIADYTQYVVTRWYRPPELLVGGAYGSPVGEVSCVGGAYGSPVGEVSCVGGAYGSPVDIWAIGCLLGEMATGRAMFPGRDTLDQLTLTIQTVGILPMWQMQLLGLDQKMSKFQVPGPDKIKSLEKRYPEMSSKMMDVLKACLDPEPAKRKTALELLAMPYFDDVHDLVHSTLLQREYDLAYADAASQGAPSALSLRTATSMYTAKRAAGHNPSLRLSLASGEFQLEDEEAALQGTSRGHLLHGQRHRRNNSTSHAVPTAQLGVGGFGAGSARAQRTEAKIQLKPEAPHAEVTALGPPSSSLRRSKSIGLEHTAHAVHSLPVSDHPSDMIDTATNLNKSSDGDCKTPDATQVAGPSIINDKPGGPEATSASESLPSAQCQAEAMTSTSLSLRAMRIIESNKDDSSNSVVKETLTQVQKSALSVGRMSVPHLVPSHDSPQGVIVDIPEAHLKSNSNQGSDGGAATGRGSMKPARLPLGTSSVKFSGSQLQPGTVDGQDLLMVGSKPLNKSSKSSSSRGSHEGSLSCRRSGGSDSIKQAAMAPTPIHELYKVTLPTAQPVQSYFHRQQYLQSHSGGSSPQAGTDPKPYPAHESQSRMVVLPSISRKKVLETTQQRLRHQRISEPHIGSVESKHELKCGSPSNFEVSNHGSVDDTCHGNHTHCSRLQGETHAALISTGEGFGGVSRKQPPPPLPPGYSGSRVSRSISDRQAAVVRPPSLMDVSHKVHLKD